MNFASEYVLTEKTDKKRSIRLPSGSASHIDVDSEPDTNVVSMKFNQLVEVN